MVFFDNISLFKTIRKFLNGKFIRWHFHRYRRESVVTQYFGVFRLVNQKTTKHSGVKQISRTDQTRKKTLTNSIIYKDLVSEDVSNALIWVFKRPEQDERPISSGGPS